MGVTVNKNVSSPALAHTGTSAAGTKDTKTACSSTEIFSK